MAHKWYYRQAADAFSSKALKDGYMCRSAYKLTEIDNRFHLFTPKTKVVVDLGSSPGSWCQVIRERVPSHCALIGVDKEPMGGSIPGTYFIHGNFLTVNVQQELTDQLGKLGVVRTVDVVTSDMCPNRMGGAADYHVLGRLNADAMTFALNNLRHGGHFVCKVMGSPGMYEDLIDQARKRFTEHFTMRVEATRSGSAEQFLVCKNMLTEPKKIALGGRKVEYGLDDWPGARRTEDYRIARQRHSDGHAGTSRGRAPGVSFQARPADKRPPSHRHRSNNSPHRR